jgi:uncharacterized protein YggE
MPQMKLSHVLWLAGALLVASLFAGVAAPRLLNAAADPKPGTISVIGTGVVETKPDTATLSFGVTTQADKASAAIASNADAMTKVIDALKRSGIDAKDIQTEFVSVQPRTDDQGLKILGYSATNSVSAIVRDLGKVGDTIDLGVAAGANTVSGPSLARDDQDKLYRDALEAAVGDAREKAKALAKGANVTLGDIQSLTESPQESGGPVTFAAVAKDSVGTPIEPGTAKITATVRVVFAMS